MRVRWHVGRGCSEGAVTWGARVRWHVGRGCSEGAVTWGARVRWHRLRRLCGCASGLASDQDCGSFVLMRGEGEGENCAGDVAVMRRESGAGWSRG